MDPEVGRKWMEQEPCAWVEPHCNQGQYATAVELAVPLEDSVLPFVKQPSWTQNLDRWTGIQMAILERQNFGMNF